MGEKNRGELCFPLPLWTSSSPWASKILLLALKIQVWDGEKVVVKVIRGFSSLN